MLGGSAPSQTSGAPFRTESANRNPIWPPAAQKNNLFSSSCGVYSLFPGSSENVKTLYTPTTKTSNSGGPFQECVGTKKVSETLFPATFSFGTNGTPQFSRTPHSIFEREIKPSTITPNNFATELKPYSTEKEEEREKAAKPKKFTNDVVFIKSEVVNDGSKVQSGRRNEWQRDKNYGKRSHDDGKLSYKEPAMGNDEVFAEEPDSTEFKISSEPQTSESITTSEVEGLEKESTPVGSEVESCNSDVCLDSCEIELKKAKCNVKVIDLSAENCKRHKKHDKFGKVESVTDIGTRDKKFVKAKTPDSSCKKLNSELSKPSPTRMLSLPPHNGGCSRTTPVTFKNTSQTEMDPKPQNLNLELPPLVIKKEPSDFHKYSNGAPFLSPNLDFFSPGGILDKHVLSPLPYLDSFESSSRRKDSFLSLNVDQNYLSPSQSFLTPRSESFLSPSTDVSNFGAFRNYQPPKISRPSYLPYLENRPQDTGVFISSTTESEMKKIPESTSNMTPCQVAEVTSASSLLSPKHPNANPLIVKQETVPGNTSAGLPSAVEPNECLKDVAFMPPGQSATVSSTVGVAPTRQRCQERSNEIRIPSDNVPPVSSHLEPHSPTSINLPNAMGATVYSGGMIDDRSANLITTWPTQAHNPTLWQYSAPIDYPPFPPVGFQLVRDPVTGHFLLIPAPNIEALQRAILWPNYQPTPPHMIIPPISVQPTPQHLLLDTNVPSVDFLTPETIHPNASQPRILIAADNVSKEKMVTPTVIKFESSECSNAVVVTACDKNNYVKTQTPTLSPKKDAIFHPISAPATNETKKRSQATSPVVENKHKNSETASPPRDYCQYQPFTTVILQDASNQTDDTHFETGAEQFTTKDKFIPYAKKTEQHVKIPKKQDVGTETTSLDELEDDKRIVLKEINKKKSEESLKINVPDDLNIKKEIVSPKQVDLSGLELLSNSIERFVCESECKKVEVEDERKDLSNDACEGAVLLQNLKNGFREVENGYQENSKNLGGLGLLCALAEQRFQEEIGDERDNIELKKEAQDEIKEETSKSDHDGNTVESDELPKLTDEVGEVQNIPETPKRGPGRPKKIKSEEPIKRMSKEMSPPILEKATDYCYNDDDNFCDSELANSDKDISTPPKLTPSTMLDPIIESENTIKLKNSESSSDTETRKRKQCEAESVPSSKKRKVGRPRKNQQDPKQLTETIVAKKLKMKMVYSDDTDANNADEKEKDKEEAECKKARKIRPKLKAEAKMRKCMPDNEDSDKETCVKEEVKESEIESNLPNCVLTTEDLQSDKFPIRTLTAMGGLFYAGQLSAIRAPDVYGITIDGERGNRPHIYSREEILKDSILEMKPEKASDLVPGVRCCAYWSEQYRCLYPGTVSTGSPDPEHDEKFVNVEFDDGDSGRINIEDIRLLPKDYPIVEYDPNPLQSLSKRKRRVSGASIESHSKERKSVDSFPNPVKSTTVTDKVSESANEETESKNPTQFLETSFLEESERKHLKKKRREKLKRLQSLTREGIKKHRKHKCSEEHRHHRHHKKHRKHKHKHGKRRNEIKQEVEEATKAKESKVVKKKSKENSEKKPKKCKERTDSIESRSKMAAFLPARQLWGWSGKGYRRPGAKGRARKEFYKTIQRGKERISIGDCAVFLSTGRPDRPYIGRIESMWESWGTNMIVRVKWFYHPEETVGCPASLEYPGALFESPHVDENDVQTISHKCEVLPLKEYIAKIGDDPHKFEAIYDNNDIYYLAGYYDPTNTTLKMEPGVK